MASDFLNLYVTNIDVDGDLLKIWGQKNRIGATYIERQLLQMQPEFNRSSGPDPSRIDKGQFCFAKYADDNYYRARIISEVEADSVGVFFIDFGNKDIVKTSDIRFQQGNDDFLIKMSEQAEEFYLARVMAPQSGWTKGIISVIRHDICYEEFPCRIVAQLRDKKIIEILFHKEDFSTYLTKRQLTRPLKLTEQKEMILSYSNGASKSEALKHKHILPFIYSTSLPLLRPPQQNAYHCSRAGFSAHFSRPPPPFLYPSSRHVRPLLQQTDQNVPKNTYYSSTDPMASQMLVNTVSMDPTVMNPMLGSHSMCEMKPDPAQQFNSIIEILAQQVKQYIAQDDAKYDTKTKDLHHFVNYVLEVGNNYNVFISHVDDGPWSFSVQLVSSESELQKLMEELTSLTLVPLKPPIILGCPCIASSKLYGNLCRGVVVSISHSSVKVYFVDFGNTEDLSSSLIYELPPKFFNYKVLSQKFSLSGLEKVTCSDDIKKIFKEVVQDELLMLKVISLKGDNLPTCELYHKDKNIKRILNEKIRVLRNLGKDDFPKVDDVEDVIITWVVSPQKFFVQLCKRTPELSDLKKELAEVEKKGEKIPSHQLAVGLRCVSRCDSDGQWYRTVITDIDLENEINVFYLDYGYSERVNISTLRKIDGSCLINQLSPQAIQCSLKNFENKPFSKELSKKLEEFILVKELKMKVVSTERELLCVQLFDDDKDICLPVLTETTSKTDSSIFYDLQKDSTPSSVNEREPDSTVHNTAVYVSTDQGATRSTKKYEPESWNGRMRGKTDCRKNRESNSKYPSSSSFSLRSTMKRGEDKPSSSKSKDGQWGDQKFRNSRDSNKDQGFRKNSGGWDFKKSTEERKSFDRRYDSSKKFDNWDKTDGRGDRQKINDEPTSPKKIMKTEDLAPPGSRFPLKKINVGDRDRGIVTYYFNPCEFYLQLLSEEDEFKKMMKDIQAYYKDKCTLRSTPQAGDIVIAEFASDKILYRAEVLRPTPTTIRFVDYGNRELVSKKGLWAVDKQFLKLPEQVIQCRLSNIQPAGPHWPPPGSDIDKFFGKKEYKCKFVGCENDIYEVILEAVGSNTDVASEIIAAGLAKPKIEPVFDVPKIDYNLLPGQNVKLYVTHVLSSSKFYVILNPDGVRIVGNMVKTYVENQKVLIPLGKSSLKPGTMCLLPFDEKSWSRGIITKVVENIVTLWLADRGDDAEVFDYELKMMPEKLVEVEPQAVECSLDGIGTIQGDDFKLKMEYKYHLFSILSAEDKKLSLVLYNEDGRISKYQNETNHAEVIQPMGDVPLVVQKLPLMISHVDSLKEIYIRRVCDCNEMIALDNQMTEFYGEEKEGFDFDGTQQLIAAKSVEYEQWYRAKIQWASAADAEVFYIDYGNKEVLPRNNVKKLDPSFLRRPRFARKVALSVEIENEESKTKFLEITRNEELLGNFTVKDGEFVCDLYLKENKISDMIKFEPVKSTVDKVETAKEETIPPPTTEQKIEKPGVKVLLSHIESPKEFWALKISTMKDFQEFREKLQKAADSLPEKIHVKVGDLVAVMYGDSWCRAKVIAVEGGDVSVKFIDYGNSTVVDTIASPIKDLRPDLAELPSFATCHSLRGKWKESAAARFEGIMLLNDEPVTMVELEDGAVDLIQNGHSVYEKLLEENVAIEDVDLPVVRLAHAKSPDDFYVQRESSVAKLGMINKRLKEIEFLEAPWDVEMDETYSALYPDDGLWYRATIIKQSPEEYEVYLIDLGKSCVTKEIRQLPDDLRDIPCLVERCSLIYADTIEKWSDAACKMFKERFEGRELRMKVVYSRHGKSTVRLVHEGADVSEELGKLCDHDGRSEVNVTHVVSPNEFYVHYVHDDDIAIIAETLANSDKFEDVKDRKPDTICAAPYSDRCWYRAKILKNLGESCEILFLDFGNVSDSRELKHIPAKLKEIPPKAIPCSINVPEANIPQSAKEEFANRLLGTTCPFRLRMLIPGEVNIVSLKRNGQIIEEVLFGDYMRVQGRTMGGTDEDKNSKLQNIKYPKADDGARKGNETDEEKRVQIGITVGEEGFKCDDEKGSEALSGGTKAAADNEFMENEPEEAAGIDSETEHRRFVGDASSKIVRGSVSREVSLDLMTHDSDKEEVDEYEWGVISESVPSTPNRSDSNGGFVRTNPNDRAAPGCASAGPFPLNAKVPSSEKVIRGAVNGSAAEK